MVSQARGLRTSQTRRFPPPWSVERSDACFIVGDHGGQALAYVYFEEEPGRRAAAHLCLIPLTRNTAGDAGRLAAQPLVYRQFTNPDLRVRGGQTLEIATYRALQRLDADFFGRFKPITTEDVLVKVFRA